MEKESDRNYLVIAIGVDEINNFSRRLLIFDSVAFQREPKIFLSGKELANSQHSVQ